MTNAIFTTDSRKGHHCSIAPIKSISDCHTFNQRWIDAISSRCWLKDFISLTLVVSQVWKWRCHYMLRGLGTCAPLSPGAAPATLAGCCGSKEAELSRHAFALSASMTWRYSSTERIILYIHHFFLHTQFSLWLNDLSIQHWENSTAGNRHEETGLVCCLDQLRWGDNEKSDNQLQKKKVWG